MIVAIASLTFLASAAASYPCDATNEALRAPWTFAGPGGYTISGQIASAGAAQAMVPLGNTSWLLATANGGIWKSEDILADPPHWHQVLDNQPVSCTSISAMEGRGQLVLAGCGSATSAEMGVDWMTSNSGDWGGVMMSTDAGRSWSMLPAFPTNYFITAIVLKSDTEFLVSARANFHARDDGGVWCTCDAGASWTRVLSRPVYDLVSVRTFLLASVPWTSDAQSVLLSRNGGMDWEPWATGISWDGRTPFYPTFAVGQNVLFLGGLTVNPSKFSDTASGLFSRPVDDLQQNSGAWARVANQPARLDRDGMPKDRMALLVHPQDDSLLFVAGNAAALVWRVRWQEGDWTVSSNDDTTDGSAPHADCRRYFWEPKSSSLLLLSDGGAFIRSKPEAKGGQWRSLSGDIGAMEFVSAHWDPKGKRWVGGAQDNMVMRSVSGANPSGVATGFVFGDGAVTGVDVPADRLWGCTQFLGNFLDDDAPGPRAGANDDPPRYGFGFWNDDLGFVGVPLLKWFSKVQFQYFVQPFVLVGGTTDVLFYAGSGAGSDAQLQTGGIYRLSVPYTVAKPEDVPAPALEVVTGSVWAMVAGGTTQGKPDPSVLVAMNGTSLLHRSAASGGAMVVRQLPTRFAEPIVLEYVKNDDGDFDYVLGPTSHDRTVSLAVSPQDSSLVAVTGWTSLVDNEGLEAVWLSQDAGATWNDVTDGLREVTKVIGAIRPSALLVLPLGSGNTALLVGTATGVYARWALPGIGGWFRLGACSELPLVLVAGLSHEPADDTLVAATMGRGVFVMHGATKIMKALLADSVSRSIVV